MADIEIPASLRWVSYLAGDSWPAGSESRMVGIGGHYRGAAEGLAGLVADLGGVREQTASVLVGDTARVADEQFALLFDGEYSVDKLVDAMGALGESARYTGGEIEYAKLSIIANLAVAAAEISYSLAMSAATGGASTAVIPSIEWATARSIRQIVEMAARRLGEKIAQMWARTSVKRLAHEAFREAREELLQQLGQEAAIVAYQGDQGVDGYHVKPKKLAADAVSSAVGGAGGGATAGPAAELLGPAASRLGGAAKGVAVIGAAGVVGNLTGAAAVGQNPLSDPVSVLTTAATSSVGGLGGTHHHHTHQEAHQSDSATPAGSTPTPASLPTHDSPAGLAQSHTAEGQPGHHDATTTDHQHDPGLASHTGQNATPGAANTANQSEPHADSVSSPPAQTPTTHTPHQGATANGSTTSGPAPSGAAPAPGSTPRPTIGAHPPSLTPASPEPMLAQLDSGRPAPAAATSSSAPNIAPTAATPAAPYPRTPDNLSHNPHQHAGDPTGGQTYSTDTDPLIRPRVVRLPGQPELDVPWESPNYEFEGALDTAARGAIEAAGGRALTSRVGVVSEEHPRVVIVNWEGSDHDAALTAALDQFSDCAAALTDRGARIQYISGRVDPHDNIRLSQIDSPEVRSATIESGWWQGTELSYWRHSDGYWCPVPRDVPLDRIPPARTGSDLTASYPLREEYRGEDDPNRSRFERVRYLSAPELEATRVFVGPDGRLYRASDGAPLQARDWAIFVMDRSGNLYVAVAGEISGRLKHSSFLAGAPVAAAGEIKAVHGRMLALKDQNNHYRVSASANDLGVQLLCKRGAIPADGFLRYDHRAAIRESTLAASNEQSPARSLPGDVRAVALGAAVGGDGGNFRADGDDRSEGRNIVDRVPADHDDFTQSRPPRQRILVFCDTWDRRNGMTTLNMALCREWAEAGHEVYVRVRRQVELEVPPGVTVIGPPRHPPTNYRNQDTTGSLAELPESVDLVIGHGHDGGMAAVHAAEHRYPDAKCVHLLHLLPMTHFTLKKEAMHGRARLAADVYMARRSHLVAGMGPALAAEALESSSLAGRASVHQLGPMLSMAEQPALPLPYAPERVLLFGRTDDPLKGAEQAARVVRERRDRGHDTRLVSLGGDPGILRQARDNLAALVGEPEAVEVLPRTSNRAELRAVIRSATVVVMPSRADSFGLVAMEAIEQGVPVVIPSGSGAGRLLADLPGYGETARRLNLVDQHIGASPSVNAWADRLDVVLDDLPAAWANARQLQQRLASFTPQNGAQRLVDAALNADPTPPLQSPRSRARVTVVGWGVVVDPYGDEAGDHDLILAVADAMETDPKVRAAIAADYPVNFRSVQHAS